MKKIYVYRRGTVVEKGSNEDWEEDALTRYEREFQNLTPEQKRESKKIDKHCARLLHDFNEGWFFYKEK